MNIQTPIVEKTTGRPGGGITPGANARERNEHYYLNAVGCIASAGERLGITDIADTEDEMKALLAHMIVLIRDGNGSPEDIANVIYEMNERICACHFKKIHPAG